ncbi:hypothetical protein N8J89_08180 [Crossiella sp. CA-258035]|uniref:hypothetical protein n=1 Tax=Crossiella sp. CA-258035 TaxID=2981138 RepID=UPI0024BCE6BB|nr:hypothetical protein [Crossiella sp. CA-258035]WHT21033.1 hypothetical protein N8J89_08180 [Crossiella sp. CA-258035]
MTEWIGIGIAGALIVLSIYTFCWWLKHRDDPLYPEDEQRLTVEQIREREDADNLPYYPRGGDDGRV